MTITTHVCRGNFRSTWISEGGYEPVAETLLGEVNYDGYFLEYDTERAGGFEPLRFLPKGNKIVVLGLVTSKSGTLEKKDDVKRRIDEAAKFAPLDQLCLSPQCGFASTEEGNVLAEEEQWAKLRMIVELADEVVGQDRSMAATHQAAVPRRPCRQPVAPRGAQGGARPARQGRDHGRRSSRRSRTARSRRSSSKQEEIGLKLATDGEFRRSWWHFDFFKRPRRRDALSAPTRASSSTACRPRRRASGSPARSAFPAIRCSSISASSRSTRGWCRR